MVSAVSPSVSPASASAQAQTACPDTSLTSVFAPAQSGLPQILAAASRFIGVVLILAAAGIWITATPFWDTGAVLIRLSLSALFLCFGLFFLQSGRGTMQDEIHLDSKRGELRYIQRGPDGIARLRQQIALGDLGRIASDGDLLVLLDRDGAIVMEVSGLSAPARLALEKRLHQA